jgi:hypothetical protein
MEAGVAAGCLIDDERLTDGYTRELRLAFPDKPYVNLEDVQERIFADSDPRGFLQRFSEGALLDEIQCAPAVLSRLQVAIDAHPGTGRFILTGSNQISLSAGIGQSLAGRTAHPDPWKRLPAVRKDIGRQGRDHVVFGGEGRWESQGVVVQGWREWLG